MFTHIILKKVVLFNNTQQSYLSHITDVIVALQVIQTVDIVTSIENIFQNLN